MITGTVSWLEVITTAVAVLGLLFAYANVLDALADLRAARSIAPRNGRYTVAVASVRNEAGRVFLMLVFAMVGGLQMTLPGDPFNPARIITWTVFITLLLAEVANGALDRHLRRQYELKTTRAATAIVGDHSHDLEREPDRPTSSGPVEQ